MSTSAPTSHATSLPAARPKNRLLGALPEGLYAALAPHLHEVTMDVREIVALPDQPYEYVYFPEDSIISVVNVMSDGSTVETGTIGNEGVAGLPALMDAVTSESTLFGQVPGRSMRIRVADILPVIHYLTRKLFAWNTAEDDDYGDGEVAR